MKAAVFSTDPESAGRDTFDYAIDISEQQTEKTGARSLNIVHVASALAIKADRFLTADARQSKIATRAALKTVKWISGY